MTRPVAGEPTIPVTIIGGYLGSGKTTLVNHLLRHADGRRLAILVNDFGDLAIDADLIEAEDEQLISLAGGCVCCSFGNDLVRALMDLAATAGGFDHVILETSGVALPGAVASTLSLLARYRCLGVIVLVDGATAMENANDPYLADTMTRQINDASLILLNKTDLVSCERLNRIERWLEDLVADVPVLQTARGVIPSSLVLQDFGGGSMPDGPTHELLAHGLATTTIRFLGPIEPDQLAGLLCAPGSGVVRAKGFVPTVVGGMQTLQITGRYADIESAPDGASQGMVVIGKTPLNLERLFAGLEDLVVIEP